MALTYFSKCFYTSLQKKVQQQKTKRKSKNHFFAATKEKIFSGNVICWQRYLERSLLFILSTQLAKNVWKDKRKWEKRLQSKKKSFSLSWKWKESKAATLLNNKVGVGLAAVIKKWNIIFSDFKIYFLSCQVDSNFCNITNKQNNYTWKLM